jgi:1-acyl-sn-glycerol-3-phosphate acyltransferase
MAPSFDVLAQVAAVTFRISLPTILEAARGTLTVEACDRRLDIWSSELLRQAGITLDVKGHENIKAGESYLVMSNHQSHYDIPVLYQALRISMRMVAKKEIFRIPFMAGAMRAAGFIEIDRENRASAIQSLQAGRQRLGKAVSLWIAPEGTRSRTGKLGPFKKGGFHLAINTALPILPVSIDGTRLALPAHGLTVTRGALAHVVIGKPIETASYDSSRMSDLVSVVRKAISDGLPAEVRD